MRRRLAAGQAGAAARDCSQAGSAPRSSSRATGVIYATLFFALKVGLSLGGAMLGIAVSALLLQILARLPETSGFIDGFLAPRCLDRSQIGCWILHPGGRRVIINRRACASDLVARRARAASSRVSAAMSNTARLTVTVSAAVVSI